MISRQRFVCAYASPTPTVLRSGPMGAVPAISTIFPTRTARENPTMSSKGEPEDTSLRVIALSHRLARAAGGSVAVAARHHAGGTRPHRSGRGIGSAFVERIFARVSVFLRFAKRVCPRLGVHASEDGAPQSAVTARNTVDARHG